MPVQLYRGRFRNSLRYLYLFLGLLCFCETFAWQIRSQDTSDDSNDYQTAFERNFRGDTSEVYRDENGQVLLRVSLAPGFIKFSPSNCPTLQIDQRIPVHHYQSGAACKISAGSVEIKLGTIVNKLLISLPLHRLMNGSQLAVRFVTSTGEYREPVFSLRNSKQAMESAIGADIRIEPSVSVESDTAGSLAPEPADNP